MRKLGCIIFLFLTSFAFSQDLKKDLIQMNQYLDNLPGFSLGVNYSVNDSLNDQGFVSVYRNADGLFYQIGKTNMLINQTNTLIIDNENHTIIYSTNTSKKNKEKFNVQKSMLKRLDSLIANVDSVYFALNNGKRTYYLRSKDNYFDLVEIEFSNDMIEVVTYYYNPKYVDNQSGLKAINKLNVVENPTFDQKLLNTNFYIQLVNGTYQPTVEFKNYVLIYNESADEYLE